MSLSDEELLGAISAAEDEAIGGHKGEIAADRADAIDRYLGKAYGDEQVGRSSIVSRDVSDVVEGVLANVLKPFVAGDSIVSFTPKGPEDQEAAEQESDYIQHIAMERNNGFVVLNTCVKDALLLRNGYARVDWRTRADVMSELHEGLSDDELSVLMSDPEVEVVQHSEYPDPMAPAPMPAPDAMQMGQGPMSPPPPMMLHDVRLKRKYPLEYAHIAPIPPDEILVSGRLTTPSVQDADFVQHRVRTSLSEVRQMGYDVPDDIADDDSGETVEGFSRKRFAELDALDEDPTNDPARRIVTYKESWIRVDRDGDGIAELRKVCTIGQTLLVDEEADYIPIAVFVPVLMGHQHLGISVYDLIVDIARVKTALIRSFMDNKYLTNNARTAVNVNTVNTDDLLVSRPGGVVRVDGDPATSVVPLMVPDTGASALQGVEYMDTIRENRTGYTKAAEGLKSGSLATDTATEYMQQINQSQMRLEMIARTIAETGVRDLFRLLHTVTLKHGSRAEKVKLRNQWVVVDPRHWVKRADMTVSVGLGTSTAQAQMQNLMLLAQAQEKVVAFGLATPENVFNLCKRLAIAAGFKNPEEFFSKPEGPVEPQKDPIVQAEEVKAQASLQGKQMELQGKGAENEQKAALEERRMQQELMLERERMALEFEFKRWEAQLKHEGELRTAALQAEVSDRDGERQAQVESKRVEREGESARLTAKAAGVDVDSEDKVAKALGPVLEALQSQQSQMSEMMQALLKVHSADREVLRDPKTGRAMGTRLRMQ